MQDVASVPYAWNTSMPCTCMHKWCIFSSHHHNSPHPRPNIPPGPTSTTLQQWAVLCNMFGAIYFPIPLRDECSEETLSLYLGVLKIMYPPSWFRFFLGQNPGPLPWPINPMQQPMRVAGVFSRRSVDGTSQGDFVKTSPHSITTLSTRPTPLPTQIPHVIMTFGLIQWCLYHKHICLHKLWLDHFSMWASHSTLFHFCSFLLSSTHYSPTQPISTPLIKLLWCINPYGMFYKSRNIM